MKLLFLYLLKPDDVKEATIVKEDKNEEETKKNETKKNEIKEEKAKSNFCDNCGTKLTKSAKFCPECGKEIK